MNAADGSEPVQDDEIVYRRIPEQWYDTETRSISPQAFTPTKRDETGLSIYRGKYTTAEQAGALGRKSKSFYVAHLRVSELRELGLAVSPQVVEEAPGHCEIPQLRAETRNTPEVKQLAVILAGKSSFHVSGPFEGTFDRA